MKTLIYLGDSYANAGVTDYEWLVDNNIIDNNIINFFDYIKNVWRYDKSKNSIFKLSQKIKEENSWAYRLSNLLKLKSLNLSAYGTSWQGILNHILYAITTNKKEELIFIIAPTINDRIMSSKNNNLMYEKANMLNFYDIKENDKNKAEYLINNFSIHSEKNKLNMNINNFYSEENRFFLKKTFTKKIYNLYALQSILSIINLLNNYQYKYFFLPSWYETVRDQINETCHNKDILNEFIFNKINKDELDLKSPFTLKKFKSNPYSLHPSFYSQELIANYYYDFLKDKI